jgi:hypothetical protein
MEPILHFGSQAFLFLQLFCNLPVRNSLATLTIYGLPVGTLPFGCIFDDRVVRNYSLAMRASNLVVHILFFPGVDFLYAIIL